ncbi:MAG: polysaccharide deacetylase family protein [Myxococcales bacterium]|nr:polysaccharide deacetylase family protein [Myxococcales bacterium]MCB9583140.1 polysaccharide deacetylase family protein [Polyangiaceae bacterium]
MSRLLGLIARHAIPDRLLVYRGPRRGRRIALTFDDGPTTLTRRYLDVLEKHGAKGTFFVVGRQCLEHRELLSEMLARGHELGSHGFSHRAFPSLNGELEVELGRMRELVPSASFVRPPFGALSLRSLLRCARMGHTVVMWSTDSEDWRQRDAAQVDRAVVPRGGDIVLLHEGQAWTLAALERIVSRLSENGYEMVTVGRLLAG